MQYTGKKNDVGLIFIYDELMLHALQKTLHLDLEFVSFAYVEGYKLFHYRKSVVAMRDTEVKRAYGNNKVFGSVYQVQNFNYKALYLDGYYCCSYARTGSNSIHDLRTRDTTYATLFSLDSQEDLIYHKYHVQGVKQVTLYTGNKQDEKLIKHIRYGRYRLMDGISVSHYKQLLEERGISCQKK